METTDQNEDKATTAIEQQTVKLPSDIFLGAALAAMGVSLMFKLVEKDHKALFFWSMGRTIPFTGYLQ
jgi:hypothetical protein